MAVPDFQSLFVPVLNFASDGNEHSLSETIEAIAGQLGLSESDRDELLPSLTFRQRRTELSQNVAGSV
jgi:restriction system protein